MTNYRTLFSVHLLQVFLMKLDGLIQIRYILYGQIFLHLLGKSVLVKLYQIGLYKMLLEKFVLFFIFQINFYNVKHNYCQSVYFHLKVFLSRRA